MTRRRGEILLEARDLSFSYSRPVIRDFSLGLPAGLITGMIGPNGSGKTTALRLLDGLLCPAEGEVTLSGAGSLRRMSRKEIARRIAVVPQNGTLFLYQTVFHFAMQGRSPHLSLLGFESDHDEQITLEALEMTQLGRFLEAPAVNLSGGEKQRLLLARALVQQPEILLVDELTANLDINYQVELMRLISRITKEKNLATLVVSHEINLLASFADRVALVEQGTILEQGGAAEVINGTNLKRMFGLDFSVRLLDGGRPEVLPIIREGRSS
jgi:iron complex transport system ATP-binding protein